MSINRARHIRSCRRKKKRRCRIIILEIIVLLVLLLTAGIVFKWKNTPNPEDTQKTEKSSKSEDIVVDSKKEEVEEKENIEEKEEDIRKVKNTATEEHHKTNGLAICMYHYVYSKDNPPEDLNNNYIEVGALEEELKYLVENEYYFPTWEEVRQYIEGELLLPEKSVVLTFDDGAKSFLELGIPLFDKYEVPATSFLITSKKGEEKVKNYNSKYVTFQSHSDNMHRGGGNIGHGGIFPAMKHEDAVADLKKSVDICGHGDAFAYPYGDYTEDCVKAVEEAGFLCAVTTEYGRAKPGDNPLLLPRIRMLEGQSLESFKKLVE